MTYLKAGTCTIENDELIACDYNKQHGMPYTKDILEILLEKGAPIVGLSVLRLDDRFNYYTEISSKTSAYTMRWEPK